MEHLLSDCNRIVGWHIGDMLDIKKGDLEVMHAIHLLELAIELVLRGRGSRAVDYHLKRVGSLSKDDRRLELHMCALKVSVDFIVSLRE